MSHVNPSKTVQAAAGNVNRKQCNEWKEMQGGTEFANLPLEKKIGIPITS